MEIEKIINELVKLKKSGKSKFLSKEGTLYRRLSFHRIKDDVKIPVIEYSKKKKDFRAIKRVPFIIPTDLDLLI